MSLGKAKAFSATTGTAGGLVYNKKTARGSACRFVFLFRFDCVSDFGGVIAQILAEERKTVSGRKGESFQLVQLRKRHFGNFVAVPKTSARVHRKRFQTAVLRKNGVVPIGIERAFAVAVFVG